MLEKRALCTCQESSECTRRWSASNHGRGDVFAHGPLHPTYSCGRGEKHARYDSLYDVRDVGRVVGSLRLGRYSSLNQRHGQRRNWFGEHKSSIERIILHSVGMTSLYKLCSEIEEDCTVLLGLLKSDWLVIQTPAPQVPYMESSWPSRIDAPDRFHSQSPPIPSATVHLLKNTASGLDWDTSVKRLASSHVLHGHPHSSLALVLASVG